MKKEEGKIQLITFIGVILILTVVLFILVVWARFTENQTTNTTNTTTNTANTTNTADTTNTVQSTGTVTTTSAEEFALTFLQMENNGENMIYSPLSIKYALSMLQEGASGDTLSQIEKVTEGLEIPTYQNIEDKLSIANGIFIRESYYEYVKQDYIDILQSKYNAEVIQDSFESAENVNKWIEEKTLNLISNMLSDEYIKNPNLEMLLMNAVAIDMEWESDFDCNDTYGSDFYLSDGSTMTATTMHKETSSDNVSYYIDDEVTVLTMDLEEEDEVQLEFVAIMPEEDLSSYVADLTMEDINEITGNLKLASETSWGVNISIPRFEFEYDLDLQQDLIDLGITNAFDENLADFSNMADLESARRNLYVGDALHKANIEFTEEGTKAAAVTVFSMMEETSVAMPTETVKININKPFVFLIRDKETKEVWFTGTVYEPNSWEDDKSEYTEQDLY